MTNTRSPGTMRDARLIETEVLLPKPKRFVRETLQMPDGYQCDWYYVDTPPSVMIVPVTTDGQLVFVRQYRHNLKSYQMEFPAGTIGEAEEPASAAGRELLEETGFVPAAGATMRPIGAYYSLPSETNKYTHVFLASPVASTGPARGDTEIEKYFDMSVVLMPIAQALHSIGDTITSMETIGALMAARPGLARNGIRAASSPRSQRAGQGAGPGWPSLSGGSGPRRPQGNRHVCRHRRRCCRRFLHPQPGWPTRTTHGLRRQAPSWLTENAAIFQRHRHAVGDGIQACDDPAAQQRADTGRHLAGLDEFKPRQLTIQQPDRGDVRARQHAAVVNHDHALRALRSRWHPVDRQNPAN